MLSCRTACARRLSWVNTITCRSAAVFSSTRASPSTLAGSIACTGSSITRKRNGLAGSVARGRNTLSASALTSPWLMTPSAEPGAPSTLTSSSTCRWVADPASLIAPRSTLLSWRSIAQMARAWSASGASRSLRMSSVAAFSHFSAALIARDRSQALQRRRGVCAPGGGLGRDRSPPVIAPASSAAAWAERSRISRVRDASAWSRWSASARSPPARPLPVSGGACPWLPRRKGRPRVHARRRRIRQQHRRRGLHQRLLQGAWHQPRHVRRHLLLAPPGRAWLPPPRWPAATARSAPQAPRTPGSHHPHAQRDAAAPRSAARRAPAPGQRASPRLPLARRRLAERRPGLPSIVLGRSSELREAAQPAELTPAGHHLGACRSRARGGQVPGSARKRVAACRCPLVVGRLQPAEQGRQPLADLATAASRSLRACASLAAATARSSSPRTEASSSYSPRGSRRTPRARCATGTDGRLVSAVTSPGAPCRPFLPCTCTDTEHPVKSAPAGQVLSATASPALSTRNSAVISRLVRAMHAPPALAPDRRQLLPAFQVPGKQHLERLGKTRLAAAVATDHHGQSRAGATAKSRPANPAKAADRQRLQVSARRVRAEP